MAQMINIEDVEWGEVAAAFQDNKRAQVYADVSAAVTGGIGFESDNTKPYTVGFRGGFVRLEHRSGFSAILDRPQRVNLQIDENSSVVLVELIYKRGSYAMIETGGDLAEDLIELFL